MSGALCLQSVAGLAAGKVAGVITGGIIGGLLLLGVIFLCVVLVKGAVVRRNWKTYSMCVKHYYSVYDSHIVCTTNIRYCGCVW